MTPEKILELARRHGSYGAVRYVSGDPSQTIFEWSFRPEALIAFAQSVIDAERDNIEAPIVRVPTEIFAKLRKQKVSVSDLVEAIRLVEAEQESSDEPVAWLRKDGIRFNCDIEPKVGEPELPLYRHPPPARKLTDKDIDDVVQSQWWAYGFDANAYSFARAIERRINGEEE